ncbi:phosphatase PAP2 family protein [Siculibacillus lacustris]|nr:phosphatase PAP2 family protein [Siculibacillus lacustris]
MDLVPLPSLPPPRPLDHLATLRDLVRRWPIAAAATVTALVSALFLALPEIDRTVATIFHVAGRGFPAERMIGLIGLREAGMALTRWVIVGLVLAVLAKMIAPMLARAIPTRPLAFLVASLTLGPGLLVNVLLKGYWGRPRPREIVDFGGAFDFVPAWVPGGACGGNCSFPSGEASSAAWLLALVFVVPPAWRARTAAAVMVWTLAISLNRMAFGAHFLSDVTIGWGLVTIVTLIAREAILVRAPDAAFAAIDRVLAAIGARLVDRAGRGASAPPVKP